VASPSVEDLKKVDLLAGLSQRELRSLGKRFREHRFPAGAEVTVEGRGGVGFFVIVDGTAKVTVKGRTSGRLGPGDHFGEIALIDNGPRSATVTATEEMRCLGITTWEFRPFVEEHPKVAWKLLESLVGHLRERGA
jgi:CRP-like cAMP-binding protein